MRGVFEYILYIIQEFCSTPLNIHVRYLAAFFSLTTYLRGGTSAMMV